MAPIKVGVITDQTGPLSVIGLANANVARMVVGDLNAKGGLLGRHLELYLEDSATDDTVAAAKAAKLVEDDHVDVILGGIYSSTRQAIKGPAVVEGRTLYIYPEQYEGQESDPLIFCTGPVPAQQVDPFIPWLMRETGAKSFYLPSADYIWPRVMNARVREVVRANGGAIVGEEYFPLDHDDYRATVDRITATGADVVFNTTVPPGVAPFLEQLHDAGFAGQLVCTYFEENLLNMLPAAHVDGLYSCLDYYHAVSDPFSRRLLAQYDALYPGDAKFSGGSGSSGLYRGLQLWAAAVEEAGSLAQEDVIAALDHAQIAEGPGGPAVMVPGQHHVRMSMYIGQARGGRFEVVESLGAMVRRSASWTRRSSPPEGGRRNRGDTINPERMEIAMLLATTQVEDIDRFLEVFSTAGAEKRKEHGSKSALVFRDPSEDDRVWVVFDWDEQGWQSFVSDPEVPAIMQRAGHKGRPVAAQFAGQYEA